MTEISIPVRRALLSVSNKTGIADLARFLAGHGVEIISTGGTARIIADHGIAVTDASAVTGFPEIMDGRVKTLHPLIHGGLLAVRDDSSHQAAMDQHQIGAIDLLVVNLYPFRETVAAGAGYDQCVENIDIGGPAMIRAAAKNHRFVTVVTDPSDYGRLIEQMGNVANTEPSWRKELAAKAYAHTAAYDAAIAGWFATLPDIKAPDQLCLAARHQLSARYGENPHQSGQLYLSDDMRPGAARARQLQGKPLSYNNLNDTDAAFELVSEFAANHRAAIAIIKHANPCGVATADQLALAHARALACDPVSAFGGIVAANQTIDEATARAIVKVFTEVVIAPDFDQGAKSVFADKPDIRLLEAGELADPSGPGRQIKSVAGGYLIQSRDDRVVDDLTLTIVTKKAPDANQLADMKFAFIIAKHVKSNAIVYARDGATVGIGAGQMSRIDSSRIAARKAVDAANAAGADEPATRNSVVASDAFFPFADGLLCAVAAGACAVIQPGGSKRDDEVIAAADRAGIAMVFTGTRHFRH